MRVGRKFVYNVICLFSEENEIWFLEHIKYEQSYMDKNNPE